MGRELSDPSWKKGPTEPEHVSEHAIDPEPIAYDHDGVGVDEDERAEGTAFHAIREAYSCRRDGCEADPRKTHVYSIADVDPEVLTVAFTSITHTDAPSTIDLIEWLSSRATIVDYDDEGPVLGFEHKGDTIGYVEPNFTVVNGFEGPCYGHVEPEPNVHAYMYDDL